MPYEPRDLDLDRFRNDDGDLDADKIRESAQATSGTAEDADGEADTSDTESEDIASEDGDEDDDKPLGPKGLRALAAVKEKSKQERTRRIAAENELRQLKAGRAGVPGDDEDDESRIIKERLTTSANQKILRAEVRAAAAGKLADPSDAPKFLDLDQFEVGEDGDVDQDEIADAIDDLLKDKPYLAAKRNTAKIPKPDRRQGGGHGGSIGGSVEFGRIMYHERQQRRERTG